MTKSSRHKKLRKQEKAKTQLTGVKKLNKAQNVVEPKLRVKKILIREQLKTSSLSASVSSALKKSDNASEITDDYEISAGKRSVQDLLTATNHHNVNMRKDAVVGLQEVASSKPSQILRNLDKLLSRIASLTSDQDNSVRKENGKLAGMVLSMISDDQLAPYWSMLMAHLKCTMTHLEVSVRYSALSFIELLVDHHPSLIYESSTVILPSLLSLIATTDKSAQTHKNVTRLKTEISGKQDGVTVRIKVLRLLSKCLQMSANLAQDSQKAEADRKKSIGPRQYLSLVYSFGYTSGGLGNNPESSSYANHFYSALTADPFSSAFETESASKKSTVWNDFVTSCVSVLIETWVEVGPSTSNKEEQTKSNRRNKGVQLSGFEEGTDKADMGRRSGLHILNENHVDSILTIVSLMEDLLHRNRVSINFGAGNAEELLQLAKDIKQTHGQNLSKHFFGLMPYESVKESRRKDVNSVNLKLFLTAGKLRMFDVKLKRKLQRFIENILAGGKLDENQCALILQVLKFLDTRAATNLSTQVLVQISNLGHYQVVAKFLSDFLRLDCKDLQQQNALKEMVAGFDWKEIIGELINVWPSKLEGSSDASPEKLFELLTFVSMRRLADVSDLLQLNVEKVKELATSSEQQLVRESAHRAFVYADSECVFMQKVCPEIV